MVEFEQIGRKAGHFLFSVTQGIRWLFGKIRNGFKSVWNGSVQWGWFAVFVLGAVGMISIGEHAAGLFLIGLAAFSVTSKVWHRDRIHWFLKSVGTFAVLFICFLCLFIVQSIKGTSSWSHLPEAWDAMLIATTIRLEELKLTLPNAPGLPSDIQPPPVPPNQGTYPAVRPFTIKNITVSRADQVGGRSSAVVAIRNNTNTAMTVKLWTGGQDRPYFNDPEKDRAVQETTWANLMDYVKTTDAEKQLVPVVDPSVNITIQSNPVDAEDLVNLNSHSQVPYMTFLIKDKDNKTILEFCGFIEVDGSFGFCRQHNGP